MGDPKRNKSDFNIQKNKPIINSQHSKGLKHKVSGFLSKKIGRKHVHEMNEV